MLATGFGATCSQDQVRFNRDKRICDACLSTDYAASPFPDYRRLLIRYAFYMCCPFALFGSLWFLRYREVRGWLLVFGSVALAVATSYIVARSLAASRPLILSVTERRYKRKHCEEALKEAERFYYLALWGVLTNRTAFAKRMLLQARMMGFADTARLNDIAIVSVAD